MDDPLILPPVFNKATDTLGSETWSAALNALRKCKNLIICVYSLPQTDIYMQYFLKAALGPNQDLNRIFVFDPVMFKTGKEAEGESLRQRYACNFAAPMQNRIEYHPVCLNIDERNVGGTFEHFVDVLAKDPEQILFG